MNASVAHRGPDGEGLAFIRSDGGSPPSLFIGKPTRMTPDLPEWRGDLTLPHDVALGHRRFAIIDLSAGGHQPFISNDGTLTLSFNGEIYNYLELRGELQGLGHVFATRSDAEVLLHAYRQWGERCFERLQGFWALALWDSERRALLLSRDRMGKAPLYYARQGGRLWFCSEIKGIFAAAGKTAFPPRMEAVRQFIRAGLRDVGDETLFEGIQTLPRASYAWVGPDGSLETHAFWDFPKERIRSGEIGEKEALGGLTARLESAVRLRLRSDVPIGLELSGGLDSSALAAFAASLRGPAAPPLTAYTVGFPGTAWDETPFARQVAARYLGALNLQTLIPDNGMVLRGLNAFQAQMDEPFHSPNMVLNQEIWRRMAAAGIRVSLNGAGGDEVFAGYGSEYMGPYVRRLLGQGRAGAVLHELGAYSERESNALKPWLRELWLLIPETWKRKIRPLTPSGELDPLRLERGDLPVVSESIEGRLRDYLTDLKMNYWLRAGNTSCMGVPLEVRLPLLDSQVVEWACRLPLDYLIRDGWMKWALRKALEPMLPHEVVWRRVKMGFPFPLTEWLLHSKGNFRALCSGEDTAFLDREKLFKVYDALAVRYPAYLWRCLSTLLWWELVVRENPALGILSLSGE